MVALCIKQSWLDRFFVHSECQAKYKLPPAKYKPTSTQNSSATGATHTVIVAPTQGVLRYVPFAVNAAVGDTVKFKWGANNHTVTKGSALLPCNKTLDNPFSSGTQNKDFECQWHQPLFYLLSTKSHFQLISVLTTLRPSISIVEHRPTARRECLRWCTDFNFYQFIRLNPFWSETLLRIPMLQRPWPTWWLLL